MMRRLCIWCETRPAGGFMLDDLCGRCEAEFARLSSQDSTYAENDPSPMISRTGDDDDEIAETESKNYRPEMLCLGFLRLEAG